jgi:hypothetical protein
MADFFGDNATLRDSNVPSDKIKVQEQHGRMRIAHDTITFTAELTTSDSLKMMELPSGAKIYDAEVNSDDLGTTGVLDIGWEASSEGGEAADPNGLYAALDVATAAVARQKMANSVAGYLKQFTEKVRIAIVPSTSTDAATGQTLNLTVWYTVD